MRFILLLPWKLAQGPYSILGAQFMERIQRKTPIQIITPPRVLSSQSEVGTFLQREIKNLGTESLTLICLDERGKQLDSEMFSARLEDFEIKGRKTTCFCFGSAHGLPAELSKMQNLELLSLSPFTMAHELALVVLLEQIYRAQCISLRHPYHHGGESDLAKSLKKAPKRS